MKICVFVLCLFLHLSAINIPSSYHEGDPVYIEGNVNQFVNIEVPFKHIISAYISKNKVKDHLFFSPNIFMFKPIKQIKNPQFVDKKLQQQLQTLFSNQFTHLFKIRQFLIAFRYPNHFSIFQQQQSSFILTRYTQIPELKGKQLKFKKINELSVMVLIQKQKILIINELTNMIIQNPMHSQKLIAVQSFMGTKLEESILSLDGKLLILNNKLLKEIPFLSNSQIKIKKIYLQKRYDRLYFWVIDDKKGIYWIEVLETYEIISKPQLLINRSQIIDMDIRYFDEIKILLTCKNQTTTYFQEVIIIYKDRRFQYFKTKDIFFDKYNKVSKYIYFDNKIIYLQQQAFNVFLPSLDKYQTDVQYIQSQTNMPAINSLYYTIQTHTTYESLYLYTINNQHLTKYSLVMEKYSLQLKFKQQIQTKFDVIIDYLCQDKQGNPIINVCGQQFQVNIIIHQYILSYIKWKSIVTGLIFALIAILIVLIFLCLKKYNYIQKEVWNKISFYQITHQQKAQITKEIE